MMNQNRITATGARHLGIGIVRHGLVTLGFGVAALVPGLAAAQSFTVSSGPPVGQQVMTGIGDIGVVEVGGAVDTTGQAAVRMLADDQVFTNEGSVSASSAVGIEAVGDWATIWNYGSITATGFASAVLLSGDNATLSNYGLIEATDVFGYGVNANGDDALIRNFGTVISAGTYGVGIRLAGAGGTIENSGEIEVSGDGGIGIYSLGDGTLIQNDGSIVTAGYGAYGIQTFGANSEVINSGLIHTEGSASAAIYGAATSILNTGTIIMENGSNTGLSAWTDGALIRNEGTIEQSGSSNVAIGVYGVGATAENLGLVTITGDGYGISGYTSDQHLLNAGQIRVTNGGYGIYAFGAGTEIVNSGSIDMAGNVGYGIYSTSSDQVVENSGTITTNGENGHGIMVLEGGTTVINSGTISASGAWASGVTLRRAGATLINSGFISAEQESAIWIWEGNSTLSLLAGSVIDGEVEIQGSGNLLNFGPGLNALMSITGTLPQTITTSSNPYVISGNTVGVLDRGGFALTDDMLFSIAGGAGVPAEQGLRACVDSDGDAACGVTAWLNGFGSFTDRAGSDDLAGYWHQHGGVEAGLDINAGNGFLAGAFLSGVAATGEVGSSQETDMAGGIIGAHLGFERGGLFADLSGSFGLLDIASERQVADNTVDGGLVTGGADYLGRFLSPALTAGANIALGEHVLTPSTTLRYTHLALDGYAEAGATDSLMVDDRTASELALRAQLALSLAPTLTDAGEIVWTFRAGADASRREGTATASLMGDEIGFETSSAGDSLGGLVGANLDFRFGNGLNLSGDVEYAVDKAGSRAVSARASLSAAF
jgi:hypothetical protein